MRTKIKTAIIILTIIIIAFFAPIPPAKASPVVEQYTGEVEVLEGRTILVNVGRLRGDSYTLMLEV